MAHNHHIVIDHLVRSNLLYRSIAEEIETGDPERKKMLQKIIDQTSSYKNQKQIKTEKLQAHFDVLKMSQYQKKWQFLSIQQRLNRLESYVTKNHIDDSEKLRLMEMIESGELKTKNVVYDMIKCTIESIDLQTIKNKDETKKDTDENAKDENVDIKIKKPVAKPRKNVKTKA